MRRKGIPGDCCGDTCGNKVRKINGISPDPNGEFNISAGAGVGITEDENGIIIDASAASGVLTINGEAPDANGNFDGVVTGQPGSIGTNLKPVKINAQGRAVPVDNNLVDTASGQIIRGEKVFDSNTYTTVGIRSSRVSGKLGAIQFKDGSNNIVSAFEVDVDGDVHFENKPNTGVMIDSQRAYNSNNETDVVTIKTMKDNAVTIEGSQSINGQKTIMSPSGGFSVMLKSKTIGRTDVVSGFTRLNQVELQDKNGASTGYIQNYLDGNGNIVTNYATVSPGGTPRTIKMVASDSEGHTETPTRPYNSANTNDIVTIGSLASNPNVVHTTGNETIDGIKTFSKEIVRKTAIPTQSTSALSATGVQFMSATNDLLSNLYIRRLADGKLSLIVDLLNSDGTTHSYITLATST